MTRTVFSLLAVLVCAAQLTAAEFALKQDAKGVTVTVDGKLFTKYLIKSGAKPILYPVVGPTGVPMTRSYPIEAVKKDERKDHIHHRSFWFTHGNVNGIDFWSENKNHGNIIHRKFFALKAGKGGAVIGTQNDWIGPDGKRHCQDLRTFSFGADKDSRWVDVTVVVTAVDGPCKFGDTKEGSFGVRLAGSMKVTSGGSIRNSNGQTEADAWGKRAAWVDYYAKIGPKKETLGCAIFNHPSSFRHPTYWHVRKYGLFTANPFGLHHFLGNNQIDGSHTLKKGESFKLQHRVLFHKGDTEAAGIAKRYQAYVASTQKKAPKKAAPKKAAPKKTAKSATKTAGKTPKKAAKKSQSTAAGSSTRRRGRLIRRIFSRVRSRRSS